MFWQGITLLFNHCALRELSYLNSRKTANKSIGRLGTFQENDSLPPLHCWLRGSADFREDKCATATLAERFPLTRHLVSGSEMTPTRAWVGSHRPCGPLHLLVVLDHGRDGFPGRGWGHFSTKATPVNATFSYFSKHFHYSRENSTSVGRTPCWDRHLPSFVLISND